MNHAAASNSDDFNGKISMIAMIRNFHLNLMKHIYIFSANDLDNILDEFNILQGVDVQNVETTTTTTEMPNASSGKTNKQTHKNKIAKLYGLHIISAF